MDFGGAKHPKETNPELTAAREFSEETYGLLFSNNIEEDSRYLEGKSDKEIETSHIVQSGTKKMLEKIQSRRNVWASRTPEPPGYVLYFVMLEYTPLAFINRIFSNSSTCNPSKKQREVLWISSDQIRTNTLPYPLFPRITAVVNVFNIINQIIEIFERLA